MSRLPPPPSSTRRDFLRLAGGLLATSALVTSGCGRAENGPLRLGHFPNVTHAAALVGAHTGRFQKALGGAPLEILTFNAGPAAVEALLSGALDLTYIGPNPTLNAFVKSKGSGVRVVAGATSGGAALIVRKDVSSAADLKGKRVASPQLGGTQDVALRDWLGKAGLATDTFGGGDVSIVPQDNAQTLEAFRAGDLAGAWVPEPWATRLVVEGEGKVLVDERTLWPEGRFVTAHLVARTEVLQRRREDVAAIVREHAAITTWLGSSPDEARGVVLDRIEQNTGKRLSDEIVASAWKNLEFTTDPLESSLRACADAAVRIGLLDLEGVSLDGLWDLSLLPKDGTGGSK